jgi:hypothetical protein
MFKVSDQFLETPSAAPLFVYVLGQELFCAAYRYVLKAHALSPSLFTFFGIDFLAAHVPLTVSVMCAFTRCTKKGLMCALVLETCLRLSSAG